VHIFAVSVKYSSMSCTDHQKAFPRGNLHQHLLLHRDQFMVRGKLVHFPLEN
jgi:hypothetical protein